MIKVIRINGRSAGWALLLLLGFLLAVLGLVHSGGLGGSPQPGAAVHVPAVSNEQTADSVAAGQDSGADGTSLSQPWAGDAENSAEDGGFFEEYRMDRERARGIQVELLREVMASPTSDDKSRQLAHEDFLRLGNNLTKEMELENLLRARGFKDAAVFLDHENITVVLRPGAKNVTEGNDEVVHLVAQSAGVAEPNVIIIMMAED